jgi:endonuclease/exonuclease/phosphatase family metal-dependent hydrolase
VDICNVFGLKRGVVVFFFGFAGALQAQTIPAVGADSSLDIACWNIEWFGKTASGYGPTNDVLQQQNVAKVLQAAQIDIWGLCEVSSKIAFDTLLGRLPGYSGVLSTIAQEQKPAVIFNNTRFELLASRSLLPVYEREFASGRLPLEVVLRRKQTGDTFYIIVLHLKANTGNTTEKNAAYDLRRRSSEALKELLDLEYKQRRVMVIGDWNDDLDRSIFNNLQTPFKKLLDDTANYFFPSYSLTVQGDRSTVSYSDMIDHLMANKAMKKHLLPGTAKVFYLQQYLSSYGSTTSDHYPVYTRFRWPAAAPLAHVIAEQASLSLRIWSAGNKIYVHTPYRLSGSIRFYTMDGRLIKELPANTDAFECSGTQNCIYWQWRDGEKVRYGKLAPF